MLTDNAVPLPTIASISSISDALVLIAVALVDISVVLVDMLVVKDRDWETQ